MSGINVVLANRQLTSGINVALSNQRQKVLINQSQPIKSIGDLIDVNNEEIEPMYYEIAKKRIENHAH
jgi:hypothetical protein